MVAVVGLVATDLVTAFLIATVGFNGTDGFVCAKLETVIEVARAINIVFFILTIFKFRPQKYIRIPLKNQQILNSLS
ncbi:MAG: hypothetical protein EBR55_05785 [Chitinophagia bacterium]|nr:hypothetical protein [Chitinophagia bacterium]